MTNAGIQQYQRTQIVTASAVQVVVLLYDGAVQSLQLTRDAIRQNHYEDKARFLRRSVHIISELSNMLNMEAGGEVAMGLRRLYAYMLEELTRANVRHETAALEGPLRCLVTLREAWQTLAHDGPPAGAPR